MKKSLVLALSVLAITATAIMPAYADDTTKKASASTSRHDTITNIGLAPARGVAFGVGAVIGTPIAVTRKIFEESIDATKTVAHGSSNPVIIGASSVIGVPIGVFVGTVEGLYYGSADSWYNCTEHPFGASSFSLSDIGQAQK